MVFIIMLSAGGWHSSYALHVAVHTLTAIVLVHIYLMRMTCV